jgi:arylsulfatase A-like enzyme
MSAAFSFGGRQLLAAVFLASLSGGCGRDEVRRVAPPSETSEPVPTAPLQPLSKGTVRRAERSELVERLTSCEIEHHGRLVDLGGDVPSPWAGFRPENLVAGDTVTRDGATYLQARGKDLEYQVWLDHPLDALRLSLRGRAGAGRRLQASFDGRRLGVVRLPEGEPRAFDLPELDTKIEPGLHRIGLRIVGAPRGSQNAQAELDWIRIASEADHRDDASFAAPTLLDLVANVALGGVPRRGIVLRAPTTVRCFLRPSPRTKLRVALGLWGSGRGSAEIAVRREGLAREVIVSKRVSGGDSNAWTPLEVELGRFAGEPIALELGVPEASRGSRVAFGDAELFSAERDDTPLPAARVAVLVVLAAADRAHVPPWGPTAGMTTLAALARSGTAFNRYRAPTTVSVGVLTTLLSGLLPRAHGVEGALQKKPTNLRILPQLLKEATGNSAFFTGVPTTFTPFGFAPSFDTFEAFSPVKDLAASEPLTRAAAWLTKELEERPLQRHLVVVHARGAHPPWDVSREEAARLKPTEYNGAIEPRRGGIILGGLRARAARSTRKLNDDDWNRLGALSDAALAKQDVGLGQVVAALKKANAWDSALMVVMGDVGPGSAPDLPYDPAGPLTEDRLGVPLVVKLPHGDLAGTESAEPATASDVAATLARVLDIDLPAGVPGVDLALVARGAGTVEARAQNATLFGRYATRQGSWLLKGELGQVPRLCALDVDPACATDAFRDRSIAARATWLGTLAGESRDIPKELGSVDREPVELDPETRAALTVWGDLPP